MSPPVRRTVRPPTAALDVLFRALADGTRRRLLTRLAIGPARVTELALPFRMSLPAVSKHLRLLEEAGLVRRTIDGRVHRISLRGERLEQVELWLDPFRAYWEGTLSELRADLADHPPSRAREATSPAGRSWGKRRPPTGATRG